MKKNLFSLMTIVMMGLVCVCFTACGSDDENDGDKNALVGVWKRTYKEKVYYTKDESGKWVEQDRYEQQYDDNTPSKGYLFMEGNKAQEIHNVTIDGTYETYAGEDDLSYKVENGHLYMLELDASDTDGWEDWGTIKISGDTYELVEDDIYSNGNSRELTTERYKKVK